ncbi:MAG: PKD domain-containing protein, partial [Bacteroidetes bacterium]|nr:PKD domain-containing protein [Bacteroidota bacterium]
MKKALYLVLFSIWGNLIFAQQINPCISHDYLDQQIKTNPLLLQEIMKFNEGVSEFQNVQTGFRSNVRIIPVVFHVLHMNGSENISKAQILDQIRILNEDYRRLNADTVNTRLVFKSVAVDMEIEFRLATIDPNGNCTDGIERIYTSKTESATDDSKISQWDKFKYLNIWTVKDIKNLSGQGLITAGYAQFPFVNSGSIYTDGVVIRSDFIGSIGTAAGNKNNGRVAVHEVGHWLGLYHPFQGGCLGTANAETVKDTPPVAEASFGCHLDSNTCHGDMPDLPDMIENYMDYADGQCQNVFTNGQKEIVDYVLKYRREKLWSYANLVATGTDTVTQVACAPIADFSSNRPFACEGKSITFIDNSHNGAVTSLEWTFQGGTPSTSTLANPAVTYNTAGTYEVTLKATNSKGSNTMTRKEYVTVFPANNASSTPFHQGFDYVQNISNDWFISSNDELQWSINKNISYDGDASFYLNNFKNIVDKRVDAFYSPVFDLSTSPQPRLEFAYAYATNKGSNNESFKIFATTNCGQSWSSVYSNNSSQMGTRTNAPWSFEPSDRSEWKFETVDLKNFAGAKNIKFRFEFTSCGEGNNFYIDNINIGAQNTGLTDYSIKKFNINVEPNPSSGVFNLHLNLTQPEELGIKIYDMT